MSSSRGCHQHCRQLGLTRQPPSSPLRGEEEEGQSESLVPAEISSGTRNSSDRNKKRTSEAAVAAASPQAEESLNLAAEGCAAAAPPPKKRRQRDNTKQIPKEEEPDVCAICMSPPSRRDISGLSQCSHFYCFDCIAQWSRQSNKCPLCNSIFDEITRVHPVRNAMNSLTVQQPPQRQQQRQRAFGVDIDAWLARARAILLEARAALEVNSQSLQQANGNSTAHEASRQEVLQQAHASFEASRDAMRQARAALEVSHVGDGGRQAAPTLPDTIRHSRQVQVSTEARRQEIAETSLEDRHEVLALNRRELVDIRMRLEASQRLPRVVQQPTPTIDEINRQSLSQASSRRQRALPEEFDFRSAYLVATREEIDEFRAQQQELPSVPGSLQTERPGY